MSGMLKRAADALRWALGPRSARDPIGGEGERLAARHLRGKGFRVLACNVRVPFGEGDILCLGPDRRTIVLVEVKTRRVRAGYDAPLQAPEASITEEKRRKLIRVLNHLARANRWNDRPLRVDVVAIEWSDGTAPVLRHHEDAVRIRR